MPHYSSAHSSGNFRRVIPRMPTTDTSEGSSPERASSMRFQGGEGRPGGGRSMS